MPSVPAINKNIILRLTYCWAFAEAGLGGLLHFFHLPFTGLTVGGFAVIIIVLISKYSNRHACTLFTSLSMVLAIKFLLSPYTPAGAYIAVSFQGILGALLFSYIAPGNVTVIFFSVLVMIESALQKPLLAWLILGNDFFKSAMLFLKNELHISAGFIENMFFVLLAIYLLIYIGWGLLVAMWANYAWKNIESITIKKGNIEAIKLTLPVSSSIIASRKKNMAVAAFITAFAGLLFVLIAAKILTVAYLARLAVVFLVLFVALPFFIRKQQAFFIKKNNMAIGQALQAIPQIKNYTLIAYALVKPLNSFKKLKDFIVYTIWLNVFYEAQ